MPGLDSRSHFGLYCCLSASTATPYEMSAGVDHPLALLGSAYTCGLASLHKLSSPAGIQIPITAFLTVVGAIPDSFCLLQRLRRMRCPQVPSVPSLRSGPLTPADLLRCIDFFPLRGIPDQLLLSLLQPAVFPRQLCGDLRPGPLHSAAAGSSFYFDLPPRFRPPPKMLLGGNVRSRNDFA